MIVEAQVTINGSMAAIWAAITNIENASETISGIENIDVIERPANGLIGLRLSRVSRRRASSMPFRAPKPICYAASPYNAFGRTQPD